MAYKILYLAIHAVFKRNLINFSYYIVTFQQIPIDLGFHFQNQKHFPEYFGFYLLTTIYMKKKILGIYFFICEVKKIKANFRSYKQFSLAETRLICERVIFPKNASQYRLLALIFPCILKKIPWKNYVRFWTWNFKHTPQLAQNLFLSKSNLKFSILFNIISFVNVQSSVKIRLVCSRVLLLISSSSNIVIHSNGYTKGDKYFFSIKLGAANVLLKLNFLLSIVDKILKNYVFYTKQYQTFYRKIKCPLLNFRGVQNRYHQNFRYLMVSNHFYS